MRIPRFNSSFYDKAAASLSTLAHSVSLEMCFASDERKRLTIYGCDSSLLLIRSSTTCFIPSRKNVNSRK